MLLDVAHCLFMCHHSKVIAITLQNLVMHSQTWFGSWASFMNFCYINALQKIYTYYCLSCLRYTYLHVSSYAYIVSIALGAFTKVLVDSTSYFEAAFHNFSAFSIYTGLFLKSNWNLKRLWANIINKGDKRSNFMRTKQEMGVV